MSLANVPGLGAFIEQSARNRQQPVAELERAGSLMKIQQAMQARNDEQEMKSMFAQSGGNLEAVIQGALKSGRPDIAAKLAPLVEAQRKAKPEGFSLPPEHTRYDGAGTPLVTAPAKVPPPEKAAAGPEIVQLQNFLETLPPDSQARADIQARIGKLTRDTPAVQVFSGSLTAGQDDAGNPVFVQPSTREGVAPRVVPGVRPPEKPKVERALPSPLQKQLTEAAEMADATGRFVGTFKDDYGGYKLGAAGNAANWAKRTFGDESGQAQWWQDYELHQSQVRNKLFGSALTAPEISAWNKSAISPAMDPKQIRENLARRDGLEKTGIDRLMKGAAAGGYSREQIEAFTGRQIQGTPSAAPAVAPAQQYKEGQTATGPGGKKLIFKGGQWQPATSQ